MLKLVDLPWSSQGWIQKAKYSGNMGFMYHRSGGARGEESLLFLITSSPIINCSLHRNAAGTSKPCTVCRNAFHLEGLFSHVTCLDPSVSYSASCCLLSSTGLYCFAQSYPPTLQYVKPREKGNTWPSRYQWKASAHVPHDWPPCWQEMIGTAAQWHLGAHAHPCLRHWIEYSVGLAFEWKCTKHIKDTWNKRSTLSTIETA